MIRPSRSRRGDVRKARALLAEALGKKDAGGQGAAPLLRLACILPGGYPAFERSALVLQRQLLDIGVDLRPKSCRLAS